MCLLLSHAASRFLKVLEFFDPVVLVGVPLLLAAVVLVAALIPARRATLVSPWLSLRSE